MNCQATEFYVGVDDGWPCGRLSVVECAYCGMQICAKHAEGPFCAGTDCREEYRKDLQRTANERMLLIAWNIGERLI